MVEPSGPPDREALARNVDGLHRRGLEVIWEPVRLTERWPFACADASERATRLERALTDPDTRVLLAARGGYGASELLAHLDWPRLARLEERTLVGFSDVSALHAAFHARLGWRSIHGPMPGGEQWREGTESTERLVGLLAEDRAGGTVPLRAASPAAGAVEGRLFGGCLSVLTNLVGTGFLPSRLDGVILFLEDVNETAPRLMRYWTQWQLAGLTEGLAAVVVGALPGIGTDPGPARRVLVEELTRRQAAPVFETEHVGHGRTNYPVGVGAGARIADGVLEWRL